MPPLKKIVLLLFGGDASHGNDTCIGADVSCKSLS